MYTLTLLENDPHGFIITVVSVSVVFASLIILYFAYRLTGMLVNWNADKPKNHKKSAKRKAADENLHDQESYIITNGAKLLYAYGEATVPKITVTLRKSYGGAHITMSCKQLRGDINYAWPSANIAVMGAEGAAEILKNIDAKEYNDLFCNPYNAASYGYIDDIIEPRNTRFRVIRALEQLAGKKQENPWKKHDNLPL